jgi:hypothetical protein
VHRVIAAIEKAAESGSRTAPRLVIRGREGQVVVEVTVSWYVRSCPCAAYMGTALLEPPHYKICFHHAAPPDHSTSWTHLYCRVNRQMRIKPTNQHRHKTSKDPEIQPLCSNAVEPPHQGLSLLACAAPAGLLTLLERES